MIYFSDIYGKDVMTEDGVRVGKLKDLIFIAGEQPLITKLSLDVHTHQPSIQSPKVPLQYLSRINNHIIINKNYEIVPLAENELYVHKNLMDQQIIDIKGNKVVRVNDVAIQDKPSYFIAGVDIGLFGILRWLKLQSVTETFLKPFGQRIKPDFLSWEDIQPLELARGRIVLKKEEEKLEKIRPEDLADHLEKTNIYNVNKVLALLDKEFAAEVIQNLNLSYQKGLFKTFTPEKAAEVLNLVEADEAADILLALPEKKREEIEGLLDDKKRKDVTHLIRLSSTPIGELMITQFLTVKSNDTVNQIRSKIKKETEDFYFFNAIYVVNDQDQLIGVFNLHEMIMQEGDVPAHKFMNQNVIVVHLRTPREIALKKMLKYRIRSFPVIDDEKHILGVISFDEVARSILEE